MEIAFFIRYCQIDWAVFIRYYRIVLVQEWVSSTPLGNRLHIHSPLSFLVLAILLVLAVLSVFYLAGPLTGPRAGPRA